MNKVWQITIKYKAQGIDGAGRNLDGTTRSWYTDVDHKNQSVAKDKGRKVFEKSAEFKHCKEIASVRATFLREY